MNQAFRFFWGGCLLTVAAFLCKVFHDTGNTWVAIGAFFTSGAAIAMLGQVLKEILWP